MASFRLRFAMTPSVFLNEDLNDIMKIVTSFEYVINLNEYKSGETHWIALYVNDGNVIYFDSSRVEHIP